MKNNVPLKVECYASHQADERPIRFYLDNRCYEIEELLDQWQEPEATYFRVRADNGNIYTLRLARQDHAWSLET